MASKHRVDARLWSGVLFEGYWFAPEEEVDLPTHSHDEYQVGLALTHPGEYFYRGGYHAVPVQSVSVIHPGEPHSGCGFRRRTSAIEFRSFYVPPRTIQQNLQEHGDEENLAIPLVPAITVRPEWDRQLRRVYEAVMSYTDDLECETLWQQLLEEIFGRLNRLKDEPHVPESTPGVRRVREYLDAIPEEQVTLNDLARIASLTPSHLSRAFHRTVGMPLHRYQTQRRIDKAKRLLIDGKTPSEVALLTGFSHQSHFGRYFREFVQTGPGAYQASSRRQRKEL